MLEYVSDLELKEITALRLEGESPSKIARRLEMRPALVREVIRRLAREQSSTSIYQTEDDPCLDQPPLYKCFINANWTRGLSGTEVDSFRSKHSLPPGEEISLDGGLIHIFVVRGDSNFLQSAHFLVDAWCLGVKDAWGPRSISKTRLKKYLEDFSRTFESDSVEIPLSLVRKIIYGSIKYAKSLGFKASRDFKMASVFIGSETSEEIGIQFGHQGKPFFVPGPSDYSSEVLSQLREVRGPGEYDFMASPDEDHADEKEDTIGLRAFHHYFPEEAEAESRVIWGLNRKAFEDQPFQLTEFYCVDPTCDCNRVIIGVVDGRHPEQGTILSVGYAFDRNDPDPGPYIDPLNALTEEGKAIYPAIADFFETDPDYVARLQRHYKMIKEKIGSGA